MPKISMLKIALIFACGIIALIIYIKYTESRGIFFPSRKLESTPSGIGLAFKDVYLNTTDNLRINGWFIPAQNSKYTVLFFHGNAGNISHRFDKIKILHNLGVNVFIIDYRGYGRSTGKPSERGLYIDADTAYRYLTKAAQIDPDSIILYGESLGGSVAIELAEKTKVKALITEEVFSSLKDMAKSIYPFLPSFLFADKFNSLDKIQKITIPKLFIHSKNDELVPFYQAQQLFALANKPKELVVIHGSHNEAFLESKNEYIKSITEFLKSLN